MDLLEKFQTHWRRQFPQLPASGSLANPAGLHFIIAVSGGADSVVLTDLMARSGFDFTIAHCNFKLRGEESERDEQFVRAMAAQYKKAILVKYFDTQLYADAQKVAIQEAARDLRYQWFADLITDKQNHFIVTAHHADDNIETVLMNYFRGTGINGLTGIKAIQPERSLLRPLLPFRKQELLAHAVTNGLAYAEDSSNASDKYTRNLFRNSLIPAVKEVFPKVEENILHTINRLTEAAVLYDQAVQLQLVKLKEKKGGEWHIPILKWKKVVPLRTISWELITPFGFSPHQVEEAIKLLDAANGAYIQSPTHRLIRNRNWIIIAPNTSETAEHILIEENTGQVAFAEGVLTMKANGAAVLPDAAAEALLDAGQIKYPLILRRWKEGDYFYPLGMQKKKKLSRFFIDRKLSKTEKEKVWVLEMDKKILWVIGQRIDDRFKIKESTKSTLHLAYLK